MAKKADDAPRRKQEAGKTEGQGQDQAQQLETQLAELLERKASLGGAAHKSARGRVNKKIAALRAEIATHADGGAREAL